MSGIGKGIISSSIGTVLSHYGYKVNLMKIDPYLNVDAGTMNPTEHGEVFVLDSGLETDQDMGNYERFLNRELSPENYLTSGMVYKTVIDRERAFGYAGKCVDAITGVVTEIRKRIEQAGKKSKADVQVIEIGGTLGDYQNLLFIDAGRQMQLEYWEDVIFVLVSYVPLPPTIGEIKTRPTQNAVRLMNSYGINPDIVVARGPTKLDNKRKEKIANSCSISKKHIISVAHVKNIYEVPVNFEKEGVGKVLMEKLALSKRKSAGIMKKWKAFNKNLESKEEVKIAIVGKYFDSGTHILADSYISIIEAIKFSGAKAKCNPQIHWISVKQFSKKTNKELSKLEAYDGIIIPGGFGKNGVDEKLAVIKYARQNKIPILGICYGLQLMIVEFVRNVIKKKTAHTTEVDSKTKYPVITILEDQVEKLKRKDYGGSMRLGGYNMGIEKGTILEKLYKSKSARERHRHRYEVNPEYVDMIENKGMNISAFSKNGLAEAIELPEDIHPFFVGTQYHPEFSARPFDPSPVFTGLIESAKKRAKERNKREKK